MKRICRVARTAAPVLATIPGRQERGTGQEALPAACLASTGPVVPGRVGPGRARVATRRPGRRVRACTSRRVRARPSWSARPPCLLCAGTDNYE
jgi:hypothetical protein